MFGKRHACPFGRDYTSVYPQLRDTRRPLVKLPPLFVNPPRGGPVICPVFNSRPHFNPPYQLMYNKPPAPLLPWTHIVSPRGFATKGNQEWWTRVRMRVRAALILIYEYDERNVNGWLLENQLFKVPFGVYYNEEWKLIFLFFFCNLIKPVIDTFLV